MAYSVQDFHSTPFQAAVPRAPINASAGVLTKAMLRAARLLGVTNAELASIIGVSPPTVTRYSRHGLVLESGSKPFELASRFVMLFAALDPLMGSDDAASASWLRAENVALGGKPIDLIQSIVGLVHVTDYLDARSAAA